MRLLKNGKFSCLGKGCHTVYEAREVIDPENDDYRIWVDSWTRPGMAELNDAERTIAEL